MKNINKEINDEAWSSLIIIVFSMGFYLLATEYLF